MSEFRPSSLKVFGPILIGPTHLLKKSFFKFANDLSLTPIPCSETTLLRYIAHLDLKGLAPPTIAIHIAAIRSLHVMRGLTFSLSLSPRVKLVQKAISDHSNPPRQKSPITFDLLKLMINKP